MRLEQWWNDTDRGTDVLGEKPYTAGLVDGWMSMEQLWNDTDRGNLKYWEKKHYTAWVVDGWMNEYGAMVE